MGVPLNHPAIRRAVECGLIRAEDLRPRPATSAGVYSGAPVVPTPPLNCSERQFQAAVKKLAEGAGWLFFHVHDSRRSDPGYPDCTIVRPPVLIFAELKTATGTFTTQQKTWLRALEAVPDVRVRRWRPAGWPAIVAELTEGGAQP
jgi:hypothetical protein